MERRDFFRIAGIGGLTGLSALLPSRARAAGSTSFLQKTAVSAAGGCVLIPSETRGPYPLDLSSNSSMFRQNVTEGMAGTPLNLTLNLVNVNDGCKPIIGARVDIWHCDKDGYYSGFSNQGYLGTRNGVGQTFFRGIQISDTNGDVKFATIYPGWYSGRVQHIHFEVYLNSVLSVTSQLAFPEDLNTAVNNTALYSAHGQNPTKNTNDNVFSDTANTAYQIATVAANGSGGYDCSLTAGIAVPTTGLINLEPETGGQFSLQGVFPNPFRATARLSFTLTYDAEVTIDLFNLQGKKVLRLANRKMGAGDQSLLLDRSGNAAGLESGNYAYQLTVRNAQGEFRQTRILTLV
jgi:protocatechuate 3,4-dioxygenase beta subunit